jgi:hypothetical protein
VRAVLGAQVAYSSSQPVPEWQGVRAVCLSWMAQELRDARAACSSWMALG